MSLQSKTHYLDNSALHYLLKQGFLLMKLSKSLLVTKVVFSFSFLFVFELSLIEFVVIVVSSLFLLAPGNLFKRESSLITLISSIFTSCLMSWPSLLLQSYFISSKTSISFLWTAAPIVWIASKEKLFGS